MDGICGRPSFWSPMGSAGLRKAVPQGIRKGCRDRPVLKDVFGLPTSKPATPYLIHLAPLHSHYPALPLQQQIFCRRLASIQPQSTCGLAPFSNLHSCLRITRESGRRYQLHLPCARRWDCLLPRPLPSAAQGMICH